MRKRKMVAIYLSDDEHARLRELANRLGLSVSSLVRLFVTNPDFAATVTSELRRDIEMELSKPAKEGQLQTKPKQGSD